MFKLSKILNSKRWQPKTHEKKKEFANNDIIHSSFQVANILNYLRNLKFYTDFFYRFLEVRLVFSPLLMFLCYLKVINEISSLLYIYQKYLPTKRFSKFLPNMNKNNRKGGGENSTENLAAGVFDITKEKQCMFSLRRYERQF